MRGPKPAPLDIPHSELVDAAKFRYLLSEPLLNVATGRTSPRAVYVDPVEPVALLSPDSRRRSAAAAALGYAQHWEVQQLQQRRRYLKTPPGRKARPKTPPRWQPSAMIQRLSDKMRSPTHCHSPTPEPRLFPSIPSTARIQCLRAPAVEHLPQTTTKVTNAQPRWTGIAHTGDALDDFMHHETGNRRPVAAFQSPAVHGGRASQLLSVPVWRAGSYVCRPVSPLPGPTMYSLASDAVDTLLSKQAAH